MVSLYVRCDGVRFVDEFVRKKLDVKMVDMMIFLLYTYINSSFQNTETFRNG